MREILFRGKRIDNGEWVYGFLYETEKSSSYNAESYILEKERLTINYKCVEGITTHIPFVQVTPDTVGQYTGLTANGKKIFEGDIVKVTGLYPDRDGEKRIWRQSRVGEVFYYHGAFYFDKWLLCKTSEKCIEVIGNIHDNPELLKGANNHDD